MRETFYTPGGKIERELTQQEVIEWAELGNGKARREIAKKELSKAHDTNTKVEIILRFLGL